MNPIALHALSSIELVRSLLPTVKGIRLVGVIVSNFGPPPGNVDTELPLFGVAGAHQPETVPHVTETGTGAEDVYPGADGCPEVHLAGWG